MTKHIVVFLPDGACIEVESGATILEAAKTAGVVIDSACGGVGACGKCKVRITLGQPGGQAGDSITPEEIGQGIVLACQSLVEDDLVVEIPLESQRSELQILMNQTEIALDLSDDLPLAERVPVEIQPSHLKHDQSDADQLLNFMQAWHYERYGIPEIDLTALRVLPELARQQNWKFDALVGEFDGKAHIFDLKTTSEAGYGLAVDIGTTTVVVHLVDLATTGFIDACASLNDQVAYGADVISRIIFAQEHEDGLAELREAALGTINRCARSLVERQGIREDEIIAAACVGNTVMTHLLLGIDPTAIRREPYVPAMRWLPTLRAGDVGLAIHPSAPVYLAPCVSSYVGGDVTAGVLATGVAESPRLTLYIDMGTNGEMVIGHQDWLLCCSCSAGPAFEGSGIEYGMYATIGAMERVFFDPASDRVEYMTIGEAKPRGICGSGLVDALATLLRAGVIDRAGRIDLGFPSRRVRVRNERPEFILVWGEEVGRADDISLGEDGIQNLIRSKAAVFAGVTTLLESLGLDATHLDRILVAGAFGNYLDAENAVTIGLLPDVPLDRIRFVGNSAVAGARLALLGQKASRRIDELARAMTNFELSIVPGYMERYVSGLFLPHTDLRLFPSVAQKLELAV